MAEAHGKRRGAPGRRGRLAPAAVAAALVAVVAVMGATPTGTAVSGRAGTAPVRVASRAGADLGGPVVGIVGTADSGGAWLVGSDGSVYAEGDAPNLGSAAGTPLAAPVVGMASTPDGQGCWLVAADGGVFSYGDAHFFGSTGALRLVAPIVGMASTPDGRGYWLAAADGGVFTFGDAAFHGSAGGLRLPRPVVGIAPDLRTGGYWLVGADGGVFSYDAPFLGSTGALALAAPVVAMTASVDGGGYRLAAADGGVFTFGDAAFVGAAPGQAVVGMAATADGRGYWLTGPAGNVQGFGTAAAVPVPTLTTGPAPATHATSGNAGPYAFEQASPDGSAARWNPCLVIHYVVNAAQAPPDALALISSALAQVSAATGLQFAYAGPSSEVATHARPITAGGAWNPVLFVWENPGQSDFLPGGGEDGMGGFSAVTNAAGQWVDVTGQVALAAGAADLPGFAQAGGWTHLLLHEIGHLVGLAHVGDPSQVMYPVAGPGAPAAYGTGDLAGLRLLGASGGCLTEPSTAGF